MPGRKSTGGNQKQRNSYNNNKKGGLLNKGARAGGNKNGKKSNKNGQQQKKGRYTMMRKDTQIRDQPFEYCVILHAETALPCPSKEVEERQKQQEQQENGTTTPQQNENEQVFDPKQIVSLGICVVHTPSGTICGRLQAAVRPPPQAPPLSQYCCDVLNVTQKEVDEALPLVDVLENAEGWIKRIIRGLQSGDPNTIYEIKAKTSGQKVSSSRKKVGGDEKKKEESSSDDDEDEEGDEEEEEESESESEREEENNNNDDLPSTTHKIMLAADGIPTIAAIFQGKQQYMDSAIHPENNNKEDKNNSSSKKQFSYLNTLSDTIFSRWVDVRESFHRYFRVHYKMRLKLNEMLKEIGMSYQGRGRYAPDMALNVARLMIACMKKGCVYSFILECRTVHEQDKVRGMHIGNLTLGGDSVVAADAETLGVLGEWKKQVQNSGDGPRNQFRTNASQVSSLIAGNNSEDQHQSSRNNSLLAVPKSKQNPSNHKVDMFYGQTVFMNEVSIRWLLLVIFVAGSLWNFWNKI